MATQRMTVATLAGAAAAVVAKLFAGWRAKPDPDAVDRLCASLRDEGLSLPVVYFSEWADRWSMGDWVPRRRCRGPALSRSLPVAGAGGRASPPSVAISSSSKSGWPCDSGRPRSVPLRSQSGAQWCYSAR